MSTNTIKAILINPFTQFNSLKAEEIDLPIRENGDLIFKEIYKLLDCDMIQIAYDYNDNEKNNNLRLVCDEEGLLKSGQEFFQIKDFGQEVYCGKALLVKGNGYKHVDISQADIEHLQIRFLTREQAYRICKW